MTLDLLPNKDTSNLSFCGLGMEGRLHNDTNQCVNIIKWCSGFGFSKLAVFSGRQKTVSETNSSRALDSEALKSHIEMQL